MAIWRTAPFRRAPLLLARHPSVAGAVAGAAAVLALTGAAAPVFVASAASASLNEQVTARCPDTLGFGAFSATRPAGNPSLLAARPAFDRLAGGIPHLGPTTTTVFYGGTANPTFMATEHGTVDYPVNVMAREGQERHITMLADTHRDGLLLPDDLARALRVRAGERVRISSADTAPILVAGVYRDVNTEPKRAYWCDPLLAAYSKGLLDDNPPPPLVLARGPVLMRALAPSHTAVTAYYNKRIEPGMTLPEGRIVAPMLTAAHQRLRHGYATLAEDRGKPQLFITGTVNDMPFIVSRSNAVADSLAATSTAIAAAGSVVALLLLAGAGLLWVERRRTEVRLLSARGVGPVTLGVKALGEMLPALVVGAAAGWGLAVLLVPAVGPSDVLPASTRPAAAIRAAVVMVAGAVALAAVAAAAIRRATERPLGHRRSRLAMVPWEVGLLVAAWLVYRSIAHRGLPVFADTTVPRLDAGQLLYPLLLLSGGTLLAARIVVIVLRRWRRRGSTLHGAAYLAGRRLAGAPGVAAVLVVAAALSIGVLTFATTMTGTLRYTVDTKAHVFVGSDAQIGLIQPLAKLPRDLVGSATPVVSTEGTVPGIGQVGLLGVDPATFPSAAAWDVRFDSHSLRTLLDDIRSSGTPAGGALPALGIGDVPDRLTVPILKSGGQIERVALRVVARPAAFPHEQNDAMLVVDAAALPPGARQLASNELWVRGWTDEQRAALHAAGAQIRYITTVQDVSRAPDLAAVTWTYGFFSALGALTGVIAIGGLLLYLATRARSRALSYGLARRMGLRRPVHALALLLEVGAGLLTGYVVGSGLGTAGVVLVYGHLDPEGDLPPGPLLHLPALAYVALAAATVVVGLLATALAQHTADRMRVADLLRLGTA